MSYVWEQSELNTLWLKKCLDQKLKDNNIQIWNTEINDNKMCKNYRIFKESLRLEPYLTKLDFSDRVSLSKFRCGNHKLPVIVSIYDNNTNSKICKECDRNELGDEFHYLFVCPKFNEVRKLHIKKYYYTRPNTIKMFQLFDNNNLKSLTKLAKFVKIIMLHFS